MNASILIGNGINRSFDTNHTSLDKLIEKSSSDSSLTDVDLPFPLKIVLGTNNNVHESMKKLSDSLWGCINCESQKAFFKSILDLPVNDFFTVNYGFELEEAAYHIQNQKITASKISSITDYIKGSGINRKESSMFIHTFQKASADKRIWHIHGHAKNPSSMIIGHYYYGNMLSKIKSYLRKTGARYNWNTTVKSWIDAFILNDVYSIGFGFDYAESDLWWLLERKNREESNHGKFYFYEPYSNSSYYKHRLIECYGGIVNTLGYTIENENDNNDRLYQEFYKAALADIRNMINKNT